MNGSISVVQVGILGWLSRLLLRVARWFGCWLSGAFTARKSDRMTFGRTKSGQGG